MLPFWLYQLTPKDALGNPVARRFSTFRAYAAASVSPSGAIYTQTNADEVLVIGHSGIQATPGAAQNFLSARIVLVDTTTQAELGCVQGVYNPLLAVARRFESSAIVGEGLVVFAGEAVYIVGAFDAGAASNSVTGYLSGFIIPRGTLQR